jgi:Fic family protein
MIFKVPKLPEECTQVIDNILVFKEKLKHAISDNRRRWTGLIRRSTFARAIQGSNSIEGYNVTYEDAVAAIDDDEPLDAKQEAWKAVVGYRKAMSYILQLSNDPHYKHNLDTLRGLHYMMIDYDLSKNPGRWRPGSIFVRNEPTGKIVYEGPDSELVPGLMQELADSLNSSNGLPVMVRAALAHLNLVMIHPFSDGNGRMGRALQTMVLSREGILDPRFSSIEEYLGKNTLEYYKVLEEVGQGAWHPENDPLPFVKFCLVAHYRQAETLLRRIKEIDKVWNLVEAEVTRLKLIDRVITALVDAALGYRVRNASYRSMFDISDQVASKDLQNLAKLGLLIPQGERRGRYYVASEWLRKIREDNREPRIETDPFATKAQPELPGL